MAAEKPGSDPLSEKYERWWKEWLRSDEYLRLKYARWAIPRTYAFYAKYRDWYPHIDKTFGVGRKQSDAR